MTYFYLSRAVEPESLFFTASDGSGALLGLGSESRTGRYSPTYAYVVTRFGGMKTNRRLVRQLGPYSLLRRAPIDVTLVATGWVYDPGEAPKAIPWIRKPFELWISAPGYRGRLALVIEVERPLSDDEALDFTIGGRAMLTEREGPRTCVEIEVDDDRTVVDVTPVLPNPVPSFVRPTESDPIPPPPKPIGVRTLVATPGACAGRGALEL